MKVDEKVWYLYVVRCRDNTLYAGVTTNPDRRLKEHNESHRGAKYTKSRRPVNDMVLLGWFVNRSRAQKAEYKFKKLHENKRKKQSEKIHLRRATWVVPLIIKGRMQHFNKLDI